MDQFDLANALSLIVLRYGSIATYKSAYGRNAFKQEDEIQLYSHILFDEAQDFCANHLKTSIGLCSSSTATTLVGDIGQKIMESDHQSWESIMNTVGAQSLTVNSLEKVHRFTEEIGKLAELISKRQYLGTSFGVREYSRKGPKPLLIRTNNNLKYDVLVNIIEGIYQKCNTKPTR